MFKIKKGLDLPIGGRPSDSVVDMTAVRMVGITGDDFIGLKPSILVREGDSVKKGQPVITDRKNPTFLCTAPVSGVVKSIRRGAKRKFLSLVIERTDGEAVRFATFDPAQADREQILALLRESGILAYFCRRPFDVPVHAGEVPEAVFVNCMDTRPLAPNMALVLRGNEEYFYKGLAAVAKLSGKTYVCSDGTLGLKDVEGVTQEFFSGKHPAGLTGTHVHLLRSASLHKVVWTTDMQTVIDIGYLLTRGELNEERVVAIAGPMVKEPCHVRTVKGAEISELTKDRLKDGEVRVINGSVLYGYTCGEGSFLSSRFGQITAINEQTDRPFMGWLMPGGGMFSVKNIFLSKMTGEKHINFDTSLNGSERPMVPVGTYEKVMPLDILPTHLLRALIVKDYETAEKLGCLELAEEDLSLCTYVCPGKTDYAPILRSALTEIEKEG